MQGERGAQHAFGVGAALFQGLVFQAVVPGDPERRLHHFADAAAARQLLTVLRVAAQRPQRQQGHLRLLLALHAEVAALGQGNELAQQVGAGLGAREQRVLGQELRRAGKVAARRLLQVQADEVDHALARALQLGAQEFGAEVARDLHQALGCLGVQGGKLLGAQDAVRRAVHQGALEERARVVQGQRVRRLVVGSRHQMADSSSEARAAGVALPRSVSLVSNLPSPSSSGSASSPRSCARALARSTSSISMNRSRHS